MQIDTNHFYGLDAFFFEPVTSITDLLLSFSCFYFFYAIQKLNKTEDFLSDWCKFFLFLGVSTLLGALAHGIFDHETSSFYNSVWLIMQIFSGLSVFYAQSAAFSQLKGQRIKKILLLVSFIQLLIFLPCVFYFFNFKVVAINSLVALIQLIVVYFPVNFNNWVYRSLISSGFFISFFTVYVHQEKLSFSTWFNHKDISHVIMYVSILLIFRGIKYQNKAGSPLQME